MSDVDFPFDCNYERKREIENRIEPAGQIFWWGANKELVRMYFYEKRKKKVDFWMRILLSLMMAAGQWAFHGFRGLGSVLAQSQSPGGEYKTYLPMIQSQGPSQEEWKYFLPLVMNQGQTALLSVVAPQGSLNLGQIFNLEIHIDTPQQTRSAGFALSFTSRTLQCEKILVGPFYRDWAIANGATLRVQPLGSIDNAAGLVSETDLTLIGGWNASGDILPGPKGIGVGLIYVFRVVGSGPTTVNLTTAFINDTNSQTPHRIPSTVQNAQLNVGVYAQGQTPVDMTIAPSIHLYTGAAVDVVGPVKNEIGWAEGTLNVQTNSAFQVDVYPQGGSGKQTFRIRADGFAWAPEAGGTLMSGKVNGQSQNDAGNKYLLTYYRRRLVEKEKVTPETDSQQVILFNGYLVQ